MNERPKKTPKRAISWTLNGFPKLGKIFNLTTTNAILMKLITIVYLHSTFNRGRGEGGGGNGLSSKV